MTTAQIPEARTAVRRRLDAVRVPERVMTTLIACLIVLCLDTEQLTVIPLLGEITTTFSLSPAQAAWTLSATSVAAAASVPILARLGDVFGMRRMLLVTTLLVVVGNVVCLFAQGPELFLTGRVIVGLNAGLPLYYALLRGRSRTQGESDTFARVMTFAVGVAVSVSYLFGGAVLSLGGSVRTVLLIVLAISVVILAMIWAFVEDAPFRNRIRIDWVGGALLAGGLTMLVLVLSQGTSWGWRSGRIMALLLGAIVALAAWVLWELRDRQPLFDLRVIARRDVWPAFVVAGVIGVIGINGALGVSQYVQTPTAAPYGIGASVLEAGLFLLPAGCTVAFGGYFVGPVIRRFGQRGTSIIGAVVALAVFGWFSQAEGQAWQVIVLSFGLGAAYALTYTAATAAYLRAARPGEQGMLTGTARAAATAIGACAPPIITSLLLASHLPGLPIPEQQNYGHVWLFFAAVALVTALVACLIRESRFDQRLTEKAELVADPDA